MSDRSLLKLVRIVILAIGALVLLVILFRLVEPLDAIVYAWSYATGHVKHGLWSQDRATRFFINEAVGWLWPFALQIIGVLGIMWVLVKITTFVEYTMQQK